MKFTEEEAYEKLVSKMTNSGKKPLQASERTLKHLLAKYYKKLVDDETELETFIADNIDDFEEVNGNVNKDKADFIRQYQDEHKVDVAKTEAKKVQNDKTDVGSDNVLEKLQAQLAELIADKENAKKANAIANKRSELLIKMEEKGIKDKNWANDFISEVNITEDLDVDAKADAYLKIYNKSQAQDITHVTPDETSVNKGTNPILDEVAKKIIRDRENKPKF